MYKDFFFFSPGPELCRAEGSEEKEEGSFAGCALCLPASDSSITAQFRPWNRFRVALGSTKLSGRRETVRGNA